MIYSGFMRLAWGVFAFAVFALTLWNPAIVIVSIYCIAWLVALGVRSKALCFQLLIGSVISILWMLIAHNQYGYAEHSVAIFGITLFPLFAIPSALMGFYLIYETAHRLVQRSTPLIDWAFVILLDLFLVTTMELVGYHVFQIHNLATSQYTGFAWCNCFHAPWWMQLSYYSFPILFFAGFRFVQKHYLRK